ncbi:MAG: sugar phosphate isomerase/epimerase family protein [Actinomycetota bacterium]
MLVGAMNFPGRSAAKEMHRIAEDGFDFMDLSLEPPGAWLPEGREVARLAGDLGLDLVGHTAWYLPIASPFTEMRKLARELFVRSLDTFAQAGVGLVNIHPDYRIPLHPQDVIRKINAEVIGAICEDAAERDIKLMVENVDRTFATAEEMAVVLDAVPDAAFHLDVGHANLRLGPGEPNRTEAFLGAFGDRLAHVHVSDNRGGTDDLHLPLGAGFVDWRRAVRALKQTGYDGTVTLEVFSREREHLRTSRRLWLRWWSEA